MVGKNGAVASHGRYDSRARRKRLHKAAIDVALDAVAEQMRPLAADLDEVGLVGAGGDRASNGLNGTAGSV
jgi:hypothetical protein